MLLFRTLFKNRKVSAFKLNNRPVKRLDIRRKEWKKAGKIYYL